jgi:hypothetical protein
VMKMLGEMATFLAEVKGKKWDWKVNVASGCEMGGWTWMVTVGKW